MAQRSPTVVRSTDARAFMEGAEECREYFRAKGGWFGLSLLAAGETGDTDRGHAAETEVFFCVAGVVEVFDGKTRHELGQYDALVIPPGVPHTLTNIGTEPAVVAWAGSPADDP